MTEDIVVRPLGWVRGGRGEPVDDSWGGVEARIELDPAQFGPNATVGLEGFSHIEVVFHFHRVPQEQIVSGARHPRGRADWPLTGIFAQRGKGRPNRIGVSICRLVAVDGLQLSVRGLDAIDGTPILDIKPAMKGFLPQGEITEPAWAAAIMQTYWQALDAAPVRPQDGSNKE